MARAFDLHVDNLTPAEFEREFLGDTDYPAWADGVNPPLSDADLRLLAEAAHDPDQNDDGDDAPPDDDQIPF